MIQPKRKTAALICAVLLLLQACLMSACAASGDEPIKPTGVFGKTETPQKSADAPADSGRTQPDVPTGQNDPVKPAVDFTVKPAEWASVEWEQYSSPYFTLTIPKGWEVQWKGNAQQLYWYISKPGVLLGMSNLDHRYAAKDYRLCQMGITDLYLSNATVDEFFSTIYANTTDYFTVKNACVPSNYAQLQALRPNDPIKDYRSLWAEFSENGQEGEGVYSAVVMNSKDVWSAGMNYGMWEINCIVTQWAPRGEFVNWYPVLHKIAQSFSYTQYYVQEWRSVLGTTLTPDSSGNDSVVEAFEERSTADTILQEKRSDMIGEYERVVDNETGNIYRAWNGFLEDIGEQNRYSAITESQYADGYVGWIEK